MNLKSLPTLFAQAAIVAGVTVLALVMVTRFVSPISFSTSQTVTQKEKAFTAVGKSSVATEPDKAEITIGISRKESDIKTAQSKANEIMNGLQQKLGEIGISKDDMKTQNYSIYPNYDYQRATQDIVGYSVDISVKVSIKDFTKLNQVVDLATAQGANQIGGIQFTLSEEKEEQVRKEARKKAIENAKANADELASLGGMKLGKIINITEGGSPTDIPRPYAMDKAMAAGGSAGAPTNIEPGTTTYMYEVTLSYETL